MEFWLPPIIASTLASLITGFFTLKAATGTQKRAAIIEEKKAQLHAIGDYFREVKQLRKEWRKQSKSEFSDPIQFDSFVARSAIELRHQYITDIQNATQSLLLYIYNQQISYEIGGLFQILDKEFEKSAADFQEWRRTNYESGFKDIKTRVLKQYDYNFDRVLDQQIDDLYRLARTTFGFCDRSVPQGLYT